MAEMKKATFAGGCFWCMIKPFDQYEGVKQVISGYTGGHIKNPTYEEIKTQGTGHKEAIEIVYDESFISYEMLIDIFFKIIDPTDEAGQFIDRGENYTTAVFYHDVEQFKVAHDYIEALDKSGRFEREIVTKVMPAKEFYQAEEYHQNYYKKNPEAYQAEYESSGRREFIEKTWGSK